MSEEKVPTEKSDTQNKFGGKKWGILGGIVVILLALIAGIVIYNTPENRLSRQLDLGQRYLEEQNYEQAVVEFDKAIEIDPMSVEAYLGKAQAYEGMGDLEKAIETLQSGYEKTNDAQIKTQLVNTYLEQSSGYVQSADYERALAIYDKLLDLDGENEQVQEAVVSCLESYIEQLIAEGRYDEAEALIEKYRDKAQGVDFQRYLDEIGELKATEEFEELLANIPSFDIADIKVMGYDLMGPHFKEIVGVLGYSEIPDGFLESYELQNEVYVAIYKNLGVELVGLGINEGLGSWPCDWVYQEWNGESLLLISKINGQETNASQIGVSRSNIPLALGDSYEKWCDLLGVDLLRESSFTREEESSSFDEDLNTNYTNRTYIMSAGDTHISYSENTYETDVRQKDFYHSYLYDYDMNASFTINVEEGSVALFDVSAYFLYGTVQYISYNVRW